MCTENSPPRSPSRCHLPGRRCRCTEASKPCRWMMEEIMVASPNLLWQARGTYVKRVVALLVAKERCVEIFRWQVPTRQRLQVPTWIHRQSSSHISRPAHLNRMKISRRLIVQQLCRDTQQPQHILLASLASFAVVSACKVACDRRNPANAPQPRFA